MFYCLKDKSMKFVRFFFCKFCIRLFDIIFCYYNLIVFWYLEEIFILVFCYKYFYVVYLVKRFFEQREEKRKLRFQFGRQCRQRLKGYNKLIIQDFIQIEYSLRWRVGVGECRNEEGRVLGFFVGLELKGIGCKFLQVRR